MRDQRSNNNKTEQVTKCQSRVFILIKEFDDHCNIRSEYLYFKMCLLMFSIVNPIPRSPYSLIYEFIAVLVSFFGFNLGALIKTFENRLCLCEDFSPS